MARFLVVLDVDSTLIENEVIELLAEQAGSLAEVSTITFRAMNGELDFEESLRSRVATLRGLPESVFATVGAHVVVTNGVTAMIAGIQSAGGRVGVVSGGFHEIIDPVATRLGLNYWRANRLEVVDGKLTGGLTGPIIDADAKASTLREWAADFDVPLTQTIAVGDGANDLPMMAITGLAVGFDAKAPVRDEATSSWTGATCRSCCHFWVFAASAPTSSVAHSQAAVDGDDRAGNVCGIVARQPGDDLGHLTCRRESACGYRLLVVGLLLFGQFRRHVRLDEARCNDIGRYSAGTKFASDRSRESDKATLRCGVVDLTGRPEKSDDARNENDASKLRLQHPLRCPLHHSECSREVGIDDRREVFVGHPQKERVASNARIRYDDLDRSELLFDLRKCGVQARAIRHIRSHGERARGSLARPRRDRDPVAESDKLFRNRVADSSVAAGDQNGALSRHGSQA